MNASKMKLDDFVNEFERQEGITYIGGKIVPPNLINPTAYQKHFVTESIPTYIAQMRRQAEDGDGTVYDAGLMFSRALAKIGELRLAQCGLAAGHVVMGKGFNQEKNVNNFHRYLRSTNQEEPFLFENLGEVADALSEFYRGLKTSKKKNVKPNPHQAIQVKAMMENGPKYLGLFYGYILGPMFGITELKK